MKTLNSKPIKLEIFFICLFVACFFCILAAVLSSLNAGSSSVQAIDDPIRFWFYSLRTPWLTAVILPFTHTCDSYYVIAACIILLIIPKTRKTFGIPVSAGAIIVTIINNGIKFLVQRPRPDDVVHLVVEHSYSFPSGHSITSLCVYGLLIILVRRYTKNTAIKNILTVIFAIFMFGIGLSRIYCGVHFPTDVFAGWFLGGATMLGVYIVLKRYSVTFSKTHS